MRKVFALALAAVLALGMCITAFAAADKVTGFADGQTLQDGYQQIGLSGGGKAGTRPLDVASGQTVNYSSDFNPDKNLYDYINLYKSMFKWNNAVNPEPGELLSSADFKNSKLEARVKFDKGSKAVENVSISTKNSRIEIDYADEWVGTEAIDFDFTVYLYINGKRATDQGLTFCGTMQNEEIEVYKGDNSIDLSDGVVAKATEAISKIEVDLGNGVFLYTKMFSGKKYYGTAGFETDADDEALIAKYKDISHVLRLKTVGLNVAGDNVKLVTDSNDYYVYDKGLNYLGRSGEMLPFSSKYYLATAKLDLDEKDIDETTDDKDEENDEDDDNDEIEGNGGGTGNSGNNKGKGGINPDTGDHSFINIAIAGVVLSLAALTVLSRKKKQ